MPSGWEIKQLLYDNLNEKQRGEVNLADGLQRFTRNCELLMGRERVISILQNRIDRPGADTFYHDLLARIAHFRTIVTTNYDRLIESSFKRNLGVIVLDEDVFAGGQAPTRLYKVHGDISNYKNSIVLTETDYNRQYNRDFKAPFWASVLSEIATKHVIFLGFGNEDGNILADFEKLEQLEGDSGRKKILIAPAFKSHVDKSRMRILGIHHLEMTGQDFLMQLINDIKTNINFDYTNDLTDSRTVQEFINAFDLRVTLNAGPSGVKHMNLEKMDGRTTWHLELGTIDTQVKKMLSESLYDFEPIEIRGHQLTDFTLAVEGFHLMNIDTIE